jgi:hypothetical protein
VLPRKAVLFTGGQGTGKTRVVARALAGLPGGDVLVLVPTIGKAEELREEIEREIGRRDPVRMFTFVWYGRTRPVPPDKRPKGTDGNPAFLDVNRRQLERMCGRPKEMIERA